MTTTTTTPSSSSSSWPWMNGVEASIAAVPMAPVCPDDDRPSVHDLLQEHAAKITKIRSALQDHPLYEPSKHDDLWIVRFWLSHKNSKAAIAAAEYTLAFRREHKLDAQDIRSVPPHQVKEGKLAEFLSHWKSDAMIYTHPHAHRGIVCFLKFASMDQHALVTNLTEDYWLPSFLYCSEWSFQWLDYVTRTTGRLTRSVRFIDMQGVGITGFNRECSRRDGKVMHLMEDCYPQLLETLFLCHPPRWIKTVWNVARVIMPQRVLNKFDMINPDRNEKERQRCFRHISQEHLPVQYGGKNSVPPEDW